MEQRRHLGRGLPAVPARIGPLQAGRDVERVAVRARRLQRMACVCVSKLWAPGYWYWLPGPTVCWPGGGSGGGGGPFRSQPATAQPFASRDCLWSTTNRLPRRSLKSTQAGGPWAQDVPPAQSQTVPLLLHGRDAAPHPRTWTLARSSGSAASSRAAMGCISNSVQQQAVS